MNSRVAIHVYADDPFTLAGLTSQLDTLPQVRLVDRKSVDEDTVGLVAAESMSDATMRTLHDFNQLGCRRIVLVSARFDESMLFAAIDAGVCALVRRSDATPVRLAELAMKAAAGEGALPHDIQGRLLRQLSRLQHHVLSPMGLTGTGLSPRETTVLRLVADGMDTQQIARELSYSERTVKVILHDIISRFQLRNRSHAVAYAMREGMI